MGPSASELTIPVKETEDWLVAGSCSNKQATTPTMAKYVLCFTTPSIFYVAAFGRRSPVEEPLEFQYIQADFNKKNLNKISFSVHFEHFSRC
jgi:hypothetical protein